MKQLIVKAYAPCWLEEINDDILEYTVKSVKEMLDHLVTQCLKVTNQEKKKLIKNTEFPWLAEEDVTVYFAKLEKEQVKLKAMGIDWDDTQKVTQAVEEMYNIHIFDEIQLMEWEDKAETEKMWETCKKCFKDYYQAKKRFGSTQTTNHGFNSAVNLNEVKDDEMEIMERSHDSEQINAMANTTNLMVELYAQLAVAKA